MTVLHCAPCANSVSQWGVDRCPLCQGPLTVPAGVIPPPPAGFARFDHTYTPGHARTVIGRVPADSFHWSDIARKRPGAVAWFTALMLAGKWYDETLARGYWSHPIDFDAEGVLQHGVLRLLACVASGRPLTAVTLCPVGLLPEVFGWEVMGGSRTR